jgi:DNA-directed RNA polymerase delta subunit
MSSEVNWVAALAEIQRKIAKLQTAAEGIKEMITTSGGSISSDISSSTPAEIHNTNTQQLSSKIFKDMVMHEAVQKYLETVKSEKTIRQILEALEQGGFGNASIKTIYTCLWRRRTPKGVFTQPSESTWGLAEWYSSSQLLKHQNRPAKPKTQNNIPEAVAPKGNIAPPLRARSVNGMTHLDHCEEILDEARKSLHIDILISKLAERGIVTKAVNLSSPLKRDPQNRFQNLGKNTWVLTKWPDAIKNQGRKETPLLNKPVA